MSLEDTLRSWANPPSDTEKEKADNAVRIIRETINEADSLSDYTLEVFAQGSYRARTNVRQDSDVDVCVLCRNEYFYDLTFSDLTHSDIPGDAGKIDPAVLRNEIEQVLVDRFGRRGVTRGNKAFDIHENSYRLDADVVVAFPYKRFSKRAEGGVDAFVEGIRFRPDNGPAIINWPEQTYDNGVAKNKRTAFRYKAAIRILKRLRHAMVDEGSAEARPAASFLIESLVWNVLDSAFEPESYRDMMQNVIASAYNDMRTDDTCSEWGEVNELKYLFRQSQPWTRLQANRFLGKAWDKLGFK